MRYHPVTFTPTFQKHAGELCQGVYTYVTDKESFHSVESGLTLLHHIVAMHPNEFEWRGSEDGKTFIDILSGSDEVRLRIAEPEALKDITASWRKQSRDWEEAREIYLLYED